MSANSVPSLEDIIRAIVREELSILSPSPPDLMDFNDAVIYLKRSVSSLTKAGSRVRFLKQELDQWLEEGRNG